MGKIEKWLVAVKKVFATESKGKKGQVQSFADLFVWVAVKISTFALILFAEEDQIEEGMGFWEMQ